MIPSKTFCTTIITHNHKIKLTNLFVLLFAYLLMKYASFNLKYLLPIIFRHNSQYCLERFFSASMNPIVISRLRGPICHSFEWLRRPMKSETTTCRYQMQMIQRYEGNHLAIAGLPTCNAYVNTT